MTEGLGPRKSPGRCMETSAVYLPYKPTYRRFKPKFRCHGNKGRPHNILHGSIESAIPENPLVGANICGLSVIQATIQNVTDRQTTDDMLCQRRDRIRSAKNGPVSYVLLCAQTNSASYHQWEGKWVVTYGLRGWRSIVWLIGMVVCLLCCTAGPVVRYRGQWMAA